MEPFSFRSLQRARAERVILYWVRREGPAFTEARACVLTSFTSLWSQCSTKPTQGRRDLSGLSASARCRLTGLLLPPRFLSDMFQNLPQQCRQLETGHSKHKTVGDISHTSNIRVGPEGVQENSSQRKTLRQGRCPQHGRGLGVWNRERDLETGFQATE